MAPFGLQTARRAPSFEKISGDPLRPPPRVMRDSREREVRSLNWARLVMLTSSVLSRLSSTMCVFGSFSQPGRDRDRDRLRKAFV